MCAKNAHMRTVPLFLFAFKLVRGIREKRNDTRSLYRSSYLPLMFSAGTRYSLREDLSSLCNEVLQSLNIFIVDHDRLVGAELADFASSVHAAHMSFVFHIHYLPFS